MKIETVFTPSKKWSMKQLDAKGDQIVAALRLAGWAPALMLAVAVGASWLAAQQAFKTIVSARQIHAAGANIRAVMEKRPMQEEDYKTLALSLGRLHPKINFAIEKDRGGAPALRVRIDQAANYPDWTYALSVIHAQQPGVIWELKEMCLGRCGNGAASALIQGVRQTVTSREN